MDRLATVVELVTVPATDGDSQGWVDIESDRRRRCLLWRSKKPSFRIEATRATMADVLEYEAGSGTETVNETSRANRSHLESNWPAHAAKMDLADLLPSVQTLCKERNRW